MAKSETKKLDALIFIDTNIFLDFYRARANDKSYETTMIKHINENHDKIITTDQVFMENKKNRRVVILDSLKVIKVPSINIVTPAFLLDVDPVKKINETKKEIQKQVALLGEIV